ncbi:MAG: hypothetical protein M1839_009400 [Geoglossum umbratile]|nr:MAG: hypothetical protein M1839_009400 [Geoglossum umbratile]
MRASVNNFGYGGSNAHAIIEHPNYLLPYYKAKLKLSKAPGRLRVLKVSAKDEVSTLSQLANIRSYVKDHIDSCGDEDALLDRLVYTLGQKRSTFPWSSAFPVSTAREIIDSESSKPQRASRAPRIGFVFSGQGAQWHAMGRELVAAYPVFREALQEADGHLRGLGAPWSLIDELNRDEKTSRINEVIISLPSSVAIQLALVRLLQSWGIEPAGVTGHSSGEVAAAFAVGAIDMKSALAIVYTRGALTTAFQKIIDRRGGMLAAGLSREEAKPYIDSFKDGQVVIACINSPSSVTISGDLPAIEELEAVLSQKSVFVRRLRVDAAYHSHHMLGIADAYFDALEQVLCEMSGFRSDVIYSSPVTGDRLSSAAEISSPAHWVKNMVQPVEFLDSLTNLCLRPTPPMEPSTGSSSIDILLEVGPHTALQGPIRQTLSQPELKDKGISYLSCLRRGHDAVSTMQSMVCSLLESGYSVSLGAVNFPHGSEGLQVLTDLTPYPWNHQVSHWAESRVNKTLRKRQLPTHDLLGTPTLDSHPFARRWRHIIRPSDIPWVRDHRVQSNIVYPGAGYISMAIEACRQAQGGNEAISSYQLRRVDIIKALVVPDTTTGVEVQVCLQPCGNGALESRWHQFQILSVDQSDTWSLHCEGQIMTLLKATNAEVSTQWKGEDGTAPPTKSAAESLLQKLEVQDLYGSLRQIGLNHGPVFRNITSIRTGSGRSSCEFEVADSAATMPFHFQQDHVLHPTTLDSIFQAVYTALPSIGKKQDIAMLPRSIRSMSVSQDIATRPATVLVVDSVMKKLTTQGFESDAAVSLASSRDSNAPMLEFRGLFCQSLGTATRAVDAEQSKLCFTAAWEPDINLLSTGDFHQLLSTAVQEKASRKKASFDAGVRQDAHALTGTTEDESLRNTIRIILEHLAHKRPRSQILEIGGGSGNLTEIALDTLVSPRVESTPRLMHYTWTDTSPERLEAGRQRFAKYGDLLSFKQVAPEDNSATQELTPASYDLVLMPANAAEDNSFLQIQDLVKPGGVLLIADQQHAKQKSHIDPTRFNTHFRTLELDVAPPTKLVLAIRNEDRSQAYPTEVTLVCAGLAPPKEWLSQLKTAITSIALGDVTVVCQSLAEVGDTQERTVMLLDDPNRSILEQPGSDEFEAIRSILVNAKGVLWVSKGGAMECEQPSAGLHAGLLRTLRCEYPFKRYVSLDLETGSSTWQTSQTLSIAKVFGASFDYSPSKRAPLELEYAVRRGLIYIPRVFEDAVENAGILDSPSSPETLPFFNSSRNIRLGVGTPGFIDSLVFVDDETTAGPLPPSHVQIKPAAFGLNFRDVMVAMGQLDETRMGFECSGFISAVGPEAAARGFEVGDRVYAFLRGYFANTIRVHHTSVAKIPEDMDMETAASIPLVFITAYHALHNMARLRRGESILIHSGTGGVGQAAIMLAQLAKAEIFVTVGSKEKQQFLMSTYGIPEDHIFNSRNASFAEGIMAATRGKGVDIVLNSLAGPLLAATWNCIALFGRFVEIGKRDLELNNSLEMGPFVRSVSFASLDLITLGELRGDVVADIFVQINALLRVGCIRAVTPIAKFPISEAEKAFRTMQAGRHMGKIVLVPSDKDLVKAVPKSRAVKLSPNHSYLIVGGLGGIGRSIATWMVERGARNLVLLSRNAKSLGEGTSLWLQSLQQRGVQVLVETCDVANEDQLAASLETVKAQLPPIKGIIQAAMVLRDTLFNNMTLSDYEAAVRPKVQGSWNLHRLLPADLDFFVMLSSISGIGGNATQANYAAGGTFQDALARHRAAAGQAAVSLDLGMVKDVGVLASAEGKKTASRLERMGLRALDKDEVLRLVEAALQPNRHSVASSQIVTGIPPAWVRPENDSSREVQSTAAFWIRDPRFSPLETPSHGQSHRRPDATASLADMLSDTNVNKKDATAALSKSLISKLASMFVVPETDIDAASPLARLGVDSLIAVELRNWVTAAVQAECSVFDIMQASSIAALAEMLVEKSSLRPGGEEQSSAAAKLANGVNGVNGVNGATVLNGVNGVNGVNGHVSIH